MDYSINIAAKRSGLTPQIIRAWEKRYGAVNPTRTDTNRRKYSEEEIQRLSMLRSATREGHKISNLAGLPTDALKILIEQDRALDRAEGTSNASNSHEKSETGEILAGCVDAIRQLDHEALEQRLTRTALKLGQQGLIVRVVAPLAQVLGDMWRDGELTAAHEHFATAVIRIFLANISKPVGLSESAPRMVIATPVGQMHELGAVIAASLGSSLGWRVTYLGTNLPAAEIAGATSQNHAQVLGLSIVFPDNDPELPDELRRLRKFLPADVRIVVGGRVASAYQPVLDEVGAHICSDIKDYLNTLDSLRS